MSLIRSAAVFAVFLVFAATNVDAGVANGIGNGNNALADSPPPSPPPSPSPPPVTSPPLSTGGGSGSNGGNQETQNCKLLNENGCSANSVCCSADNLYCAPTNPDKCTTCSNCLPGQMSDGGCDGLINRKCKACGIDTPAGNTDRCLTPAPWSSTFECKCALCQPGFQLVDGVCTACSDCLITKKKIAGSELANSGSCDGLADRQCVDCDSSFTSTGCAERAPWSLNYECKCKTPADNYYLSAGDATECFKCPNHQKTKDDTCVGTNNRLCENCGNYKCTEYDIWAPGSQCKCLTCDSGHYLNDSGVCTPCTGCGNDQKKTGGCDGKNDDTCDDCSWADDDANTADPDVTTCDVWETWTRESYEAGTECKCETCDAPSQSYIGSYLTPTKTCDACKPCLDTISNSNRQTRTCDGTVDYACESCSVFLAGTDAAQCKTWLPWSESSVCQCDVCKPTYQLGNRACTACAGDTAAKNNCLTPTENACTCDVCAEGHYKDQSTGLCTPCTASCTTQVGTYLTGSCSTSQNPVCETCTTCSTGYSETRGCSTSEYTATQDRGCAPCAQTGCTAWEDWNPASPGSCRCKTCNSGFVLSNGECQCSGTVTDGICAPVRVAAVCSGGCGSCQNCDFVDGIPTCVPDPDLFGSTCTESGKTGYCTTSGNCKKVTSCTNFEGPGCNVMCAFAVTGTEVKEYHCRFNGQNPVCGNDSGCIKGACTCKKPALLKPGKGKRLLMEFAS